MSKQKILKVGKITLALFLIISVLSMSLSFIRKDNGDDTISEDVGITKEPIKSPLAGKYISFLGDSITTYEGWSNSTTFNSTIGGNGVYYNASSGLTVHDTWWKQLIDTNGMRLCVNNSWNAGRITPRVDIPGAKSRCQQLYNDSKEIYPDVIVIYLGTNDIANGITSDRTFEEAYELVLSGASDIEDPLYMLIFSIEIMRTKYNCDIFVCTLPPESRTCDKAEELEFFNEQIREIEGNIDNCYVVDLFSDSGITYDNYMNYTIDDGSLRVHPNRFGMDLITNCVQATFERVYGF